MKKRLFTLAWAFWVALAWGQTNSTPGAANDTKVTLEPAAAAPAGAGGTVELRNLLQKRPGATTVSVEIENLTPGDYLLSVGRKSSPTLETAGAITIPDPAAIPAGTGGPSSKEDSTTHSGQVVRTKIRAELQLRSPATDIDRIVISDSGSNTLLEASLPQ